MKHRFLLHAIRMAAIGFILAGFSGQGLSAGEVTILSTRDLERMLESPIKPTLIYTLSRIEFMEARIPGSICVPMEKMEHSGKLPVDPNTALVFYCLGPGWVKSSMAAGKAVKMGYNKVFWYREGMAGWKKNHNFLETEDLTYSTRRLPKPTSARRLKEQLDKGRGSVLLVDIRDDKSREQFGVIGGETIHIPLHDLVREYRKLPTDKELMLYDIRAKQAPAAIRFLLDKKYAFSKISWLDGGTEGWAEKGYPLR